MSRISRKEAGAQKERHFNLKGVISVSVLLLTLAIYPQAKGGTATDYKPFSGVIHFGRPYDTGKTSKAASLKIPDRLASLNTIVIDPGHGGIDAGALGPSGMQEKEVTLRIAITLKKLLQTGLGSRVFLTRNDDSTLNPQQRAGIANGFRADLFISIHTSAAADRKVKGIEIFLPTDSGDTSLTSARSGSRKSPRRKREDIIEWDTVQLDYLPMSRLLGRLIQLNLTREMDGEVVARELPMLTLSGVNMPSLEIEVGYITNLSTEMELQNQEQINRLAVAIYKGIKQYKEILLLTRKQP